MNALMQFMRRFRPQTNIVSHSERLRACCGALLGILITASVSALLVDNASLPFLMAPIGASAVLLYAAPASPLAQPWSIMGGNMLSAIAGVLCASWIPSPLLAAAAAIFLAIGLMFAMRCLHPPGGAVALTAVIGGPAIHQLGWGYVLMPVGLNSLLLLVVALIYNNATRRPYPHAQQLEPERSLHETQDIPPLARMGFTHADMDAVLKDYNQVLDISRDDLESLFLQTEMHAYRRRFGEIRCQDIMSRSLITVEFGTTLEEAWQLLLRHHLKALPVLDKARRVSGIITQGDFMRQADLAGYQGIASKLKQVVQRIPFTHTDKPEVVGQIMTNRVITASTDMHIVELIPLVSEHNLHHIPVVDQERRLAGMISQSDLIAGLYRGRLNSMASG
ncbi:CBS domain-containing membrane protein [Methylovorus glucosotrophus]|uniref:HPP family protein n=1 Tax=Methylovorus glucosotrophus TaxID=266009 RepID=UPI001331ADFD|nr:HPP family protein [Methylovorus glucosotrophus]KAF0843304.1 CBS domain-containing membrane protein [Methylovorus glucosotrophus]